MRTIKAIILFIVLVCGVDVVAQTLQQVTDNGATTSNGISAAQVTVNSLSLAGSNLPTTISLLNGYRINGSIPDASHNGITYQSGGGGGAAIGFFRGGSYDTGMDFYTNYDGGYQSLQHRMRIASNGNVGIGTANPIDKLQVITNSRRGEIRIGGGNGSGEGRVFIQADMVNDKSYIDVFGDDIYKSLRIDASTLILNSFSNGNVGIGTIDTKGYKLAVNGNIRTKEIKVETANWPDFVFAKSYRLPTLPETEKHIKEKGHLPGIPSAAEVKANGIDLGEMNAKLLQKIEELTLHLIEKNKHIENLEDRLKKVETFLIK